MSNLYPVIAAISTPLAPAGLGVIRLSGDGAVAVAEKVFRPAGKARKLSELPGYSALYGRVYDGQGEIDECVALVFRAPHSYTGEEVVELSCHGGLYLLRRVLRAVLDAGARPAEAGEFTRRAFLNGKMDLTRAEAVIDLIAANGRLAAKAAISAREGAVYRRLEEVKSALLGMAANLSAFVDYPDDDIPALTPEALGPQLTAARDAVQALLDTYDAGRVLREGVDTVIVGSPNVGKSTLMNRLAGCERSIVTPLAGTTRDVVEETVRLGDVLLRLADTAGLRATEDEVESIGVRRAQSRMETAALLLVVFDGSRPLTEDDRRMAESASRQNAVAVINKADLGLDVNEEYIRSIFQRVVVVSARDGEGIPVLEQAVREAVGLAGIDGTQPLLANERQRRCAAACLDCLEEALAALAAGMTLDAVGVDIDGAVSALLELTGERATEAVVDEVFARFCVGK